MIIVANLRPKFIMPGKSNIHVAYPLKLNFMGYKPKQLSNFSFDIIIAVKNVKPTIYKFVFIIELMVKLIDLINENISV
jgi:hypothetical protein